MSEKTTTPLARCAMSEVTTFDWTFEEDVAGYAEAGFGAIGLWQNKLTDGPFISSIHPYRPDPRVQIGRRSARDPRRWPRRLESDLCGRLHAA